MKKFFWIIVILLAVGYIFGKNDKPRNPTEQQQVPSSAEAQSTPKAQVSERKYIGPKDWKTYLRDSKSEASYKDVIKLDENTLEVMNSLQIGYACVYNHYRFNCTKKQWLQIEVAALPCGVPFKMAPGPSSNEWFDLNWKETGKEIKKLYNLTCNGALKK